MAVVTGASQRHRRGIGAGIVANFRAQGYAVVANSRRIAPVTRNLAVESADRGIRVNAVGPGVIKTPMNPPEVHEAAVRLHPMGRMGEVHEIVEAVLYFERVGVVTGETIDVDGGQHAGRW